MPLTTKRYQVHSFLALFFCRLMLKIRTIDDTITMPIAKAPAIPKVFSPTFIAADILPNIR